MSFDRLHSCVTFASLRFLSPLKFCARAFFLAPFFSLSSYLPTTICFLSYYLNLNNKQRRSVLEEGLVRHPTPSMFTVRNVGKTPQTRTQGTKICLGWFKGEIFECLPADLNQDEDQAFRKMFLKCEDVQVRTC